MDIENIKFRCIHKNGREMKYGYEPIRLLHGKANKSTLVAFNAYHFMQFTGLKDKTGKEIYEGDILKGKFDSAIYRVDFETGKFVLNHILKHMPDRWGDLSRLFDNDMTELYDDIEIIGNIYENSDLLS